MAGRKREEARDTIRERRVVAGAVGGSKLDSLQGEAERLLAEHGVAGADSVLEPGDEAEAESGLRRTPPILLDPRGRKVNGAPASDEDAVLARAANILRERELRAQESPEPGEVKTLTITLDAQRYFEGKGYKPEVAARLATAYAIIEAANVLSSLRDAMFRKPTENA